MDTGLSIVVVDPDEDYLGIDIRVASGRFSGSARIYAGLDQLGEFARAIAGFPVGPDDRRVYEFGIRDPGCAGGFVALTFFCRDRAGHPMVTASIEDDPQWHSKASAELSFDFEAASLDRFLRSLLELEGKAAGSAQLPAVPRR